MSKAVVIATAKDSFLPVSISVEPTCGDLILRPLVVDDHGDGHFFDTFQEANRVVYQYKEGPIGHNVRRATWKRGHRDWGWEVDEVDDRVGYYDSDREDFHADG